MNDIFTFTGAELDPQPPPSRPVVTSTLVHVDLSDERLQDVLGRVVQAISGVYPDAEFASYIGTNPLGVYIEVYTNNNEFEGILRIMNEKLGNLHIAAGLDVCVLPRRKAQAQAA